MKKNKILILFAHPLYEKSKVNRVLVESIPHTENITFHDLYEEYPNFEIDIKREQELLLNHDIIIWQHPLYWYSCPALLKQWIDMVLVYDWAYGGRGGALTGKTLMQVITTGGARENYCPTGLEKHTIPDLLEPFSQTALMCGMRYLPPFVFHDVNNVSPEVLNIKGQRYGNLLDYLLRYRILEKELEGFIYLNDWFKHKTE
ncbi:NAD(P)H-dependent oxidoreductase [Weeksellaceae bacterium TAE3-ERU29]|nr:NAD(P)H-dependent oxidoreductase [Weeksellaceae bacterium TAE3-ERU29]